MTSHASARNAIKATAPGAWRLEWLVCVDWYDGVESGFVVLDGPVRLGVAVERLGGAGHVTVYRGWLLPTGAAGVVAAMGEADAPAPWARHFTPNAPMDAETIDTLLRDADPVGLILALDVLVGSVLAVAVIDREVVGPLPSHRAFGDYSLPRADYR